MNNATVGREDMTRKPGDVKDKMEEAKESGKEAAQTVGERGKETVQDAAQKAREAARSAGEKANQATQYAGEKADDAVASVGCGIESIAGTIREKGPEGKVTSSVADALEDSGKYLREQGLSGMAGDLTNMVRQHPIAAMLISVGVGYFLARATRS